MQPAENKDYSRDVILRLSPTRNTIIVEEQKPGGIAAYREIDPLELYYVINQSYASNDYLDSGFLPEHCLHLSMSATEKYFVLWNPELRADVIYGDREYPNFPIPRMVFGVRVLENGKVAECSMGVVADEAPTVDNLVLDDAVDVQGCCRKAEELFELYQRCANRKQIETICVNFLRGMEATKLSVTGHMYFVPRTFMERVDIFEDFITLLSGLNKKQTPLVVNSFYIIDDAKQRDKMTEEFYLAVKKEIAAYQEKCDYLIKSSSQSPAVMERWVLKVQALEEKKRHYEGVLQRELDGLDDEFSVLKLLSQELQVRANGIRNLRFQQRAA